MEPDELLCLATDACDRVQKEKIDRDYIAKWAKHFAVSDIWQMILQLSDADPVQ